MQFKDPFKDYKKNNSLKNLEVMYVAMEKILNDVWVDNHTYWKKIIKLSNELGYNISPSAVITFIENYISKAEIIKVWKQKHLPKDKETLMVLKKELLYEYYEKKSTFNIKNSEIESSIYHVVVSFKYAQLELEALKIFLKKIKNHSGLKTPRIIFYMADNFFKNAPDVTPDEFLSLETLLITMQQAKTTLEKIEKKNKQFRSVMEHFNKTTQVINSFMLNLGSSLNLDIMESTSDFVNPVHFDLFLKQYCKEHDIIYKIVDNTKYTVIRNLLDKENTNNIIYLNVNSMLTYYKKEIRDYTFEDICVSNNIEFLDILFQKNKKKDNEKANENSVLNKNAEISTNNYDD